MLLQTIKQCKIMILTNLVDLISYVIIDLRNDQRRLWIIKNRLFHLPYEQFEFTRLQKVRTLMDVHMSYDKE